MLLFLSAAVGLGAFGYVGYALWVQRHPPGVIRIEPQGSCDLQQGACRAALPGGGELRVTLSPRPVAPRQPITVEVEFVGFDTEAVETTLESPDMYMGYFRQPLAAEGTDRYRGLAVLPACTLGPRRWRLTVLARQPRRTYAVPFVFNTRSAAL